MKDILIKLIANAIAQKENFEFWDYKSVEKWLLEQDEYKEILNRPIQIYEGIENTTVEINDNGIIIVKQTEIK